MTDAQRPETLEEVRHKEEFQRQRAGVWEDLVGILSRELADARTDRRQLSDRALALDIECAKVKAREHRLVSRVKLAFEFIQDVHHKEKPSHAKDPDRANAKGCQACGLYESIRRDIQAFGEELAR